MVLGMLHRTGVVRRTTSNSGSQLPPEGPAAHNRSVPPGGDVQSKSRGNESHSKSPTRKHHYGSQRNRWLRFRRKPFLGSGRRELIIQAFLIVSLILSFLFTFVLHRNMKEQRPHFYDKSPSHPIDYHRRALWNAPESILSPERIVLHRHHGRGRIHVPDPLYDEEDMFWPDLGGLEISFFEEEGQTRAIYHDFDLDRTEFRPPQDFNLDDDVDQYYAFDDDFLRSSYVAYDDKDLQYQKRCRRTEWHRLLRPTCNNVHELSIGTSVIPTYLSYGAYREVFKVEHDLLGHPERMAFKMFRSDYDYKYDHYEYTRMDALVSERLTSSPRIVDIYGLCGLAHLFEFFSNGDIEGLVAPGRHHHHHEQPKSYDNQLNSTEKITLALDMAEALADLHGWKDGVMVHDDIQLSQFLLTDDKRVKMNDFNRAEAMLFDEEEQQYCRFRNGPGNGDWRAPEEYQDHPLNEKIDIWSLGNNFYTLLTSSYPFQGTRVEEIQRRIVQHETDRIPSMYRNRSHAEDVLSEVIMKCWEYDPDDRPEIFEIVATLRKGLEEHKKSIEK